MRQTLPPRLADWFTTQGWRPHRHQMDMLRAPGHALLIAPTGGGKTLAGFLPTLADACTGDDGAGHAHALCLAAEGADA